MISAQEMAENLEDLERVKAQAAAELSLAEVKPIQTDYHFFVQDMRDQLRRLAEAEVDQSLQGRDQAFIDENRRYLINSNLNCRLLHAWEELGKEDREKYSIKEEEDRRRFMEDDEVASRHCFTLTARVRSPIKKASDKRHEKGERRTTAKRHRRGSAEPATRTSRRGRHGQTNRNGGVRRRVSFQKESPKIRTCLPTKQLAGHRLTGSDTSTCFCIVCTKGDVSFFSLKASGKLNAHHCIELSIAQ